MLMVSFFRAKEILMQVEPYLFFDGCCEAALEFYRKALGAEVTFLMRYKESPEPEMCPPGSEEKVMHASLRIGESTIMASDNCEGKVSFQGFSLSLAPADAVAAEGLFTALAEDGKVQMPLARTFWSPCFGMVVDRFGVSWMINVME
jgi:PhnB protein